MITKSNGRKIEYLVTKTPENRIIRVYQLDNEITLHECENPLTLPILVDGDNGYSESLVDILTQRRTLMGRCEYLEKEVKRFSDKYYELKENNNKKWYQFWK